MIIEITKIIVEMTSFQILFLIMLLFYFQYFNNKNYSFVYIPNKYNASNILWDNKNIIQPLFNETVIQDNYIFNSFSYKFYIRENDIISDTIRAKHYWPDCNDIYYIWKKHNLWNYKILIDVGANIGSCSLFMLHYKIKVISFEPIKNNLHLFTKSILSEKKYINNIKLFTIALGNENNIKTIYINPTNWGGSSIKYKTKYPERIKMYRLDDLNITFKEKIGMIKIDVECNELNMIKGGINFIKNNYIKIIYYEQNCYCGNIKIETIKIYEILESLGYVIHKKIYCKTKIVNDIIAIRVK